VRRWISRSVEETEAIGRELAVELVPDGTLLLAGELGAGKTALVRGLAAGLGVSAGEVQSPTFTLMREHLGTGGRLLHLDLYRLSPEEVAATGFEELLLGSGVKAVEWPERLPFALPGARLLTIAREAGDRRRLELSEAPGADSR
jgi:tRNA threonylcarbamoyladenosine biosynthesis protein TsaE